MKKILILLLLFVNLHAFISDDGLQITCGSTACAQRMYTEGDIDNPLLTCSYCGKTFSEMGECSYHELTCSQNPFYNPIGSDYSTSSDIVETNTQYYEFGTGQKGQTNEISMERSPITTETILISGKNYTVLYYEEGVYVRYQNEYPIKLLYYKYKIPSAEYERIEKKWKYLKQFIICN